MKRLVVFIPAFNEEKTIARVIKKIPKEILGLEVVVLVVNDGSSDQTAKVAKQAGAVVVNHPTNLGVGKAFQTGLEEALKLKADVLVNIDADGQFDPDEIPKLIKPIINHQADFVSADRFTDPKTGKKRRPPDMPQAKYWGNLLMAKLISFLAGQEFADVSCGFRAYNKKAMLSLNLMGKFTYTQESFLDLATKGLQIKLVPTKVKYFADRKSRVAGNLLHYGYKTFKIIIRAFRDYKPLLFFVYLSVIPFVLSILTGIFLAYHYFIAGQFTPYKSVGFAFIYFSTLTLALVLTGFLADMFVRLRLNQEKILYLIKSQKLE